jgi:hypothetical protein
LAIKHSPQSPGLPAAPVEPAALLPPVAAPPSPPPPALVPPVLVAPELPPKPLVPAEPAALEPAALEPAALEPAALEPAALPAAMLAPLSPAAPASSLPAAPASPTPPALVKVELQPKHTASAVKPRETLLFIERCRAWPMLQRITRGASHGNGHSGLTKRAVATLRTGPLLFWHFAARPADFARGLQANAELCQ